MPAVVQAGQESSSTQGTSGDKSETQVGEIKKALKRLETEIPHETSKAAQSVKEGFKKRFKTNTEGTAPQK
jgi:hypothetical protein